MVEVDLSRELAAFLHRQPKLLRELGPAWVVFIDDDLMGHFAAFEEAAEFALREHRDEEFLIAHTTNSPAEVPMFLT